MGNNMAFMQPQPQFFGQQQIVGQSGFPPQQPVIDQFAQMQVTASAPQQTQAPASQEAPAKSGFNVSSTEFVPRGRIVKTTEQFPTLGEDAPKTTKKPTPVVQQRRQEEEPIQPQDPTFGNPKEFFIMYPPNPYFPPDPFNNPLLPTQDQMVFIYQYYPTHAANPGEMIMWLYNYAAFNEE